MLQLCFRSSYLSRWSWWRKRHCLHQGMLERSFRCWFPEKYPWGGWWSYVSRPSTVTTENFESVIIASGDTDVFVCSIYHFNRWIYRGLKEIWIVSGKSCSTTVFPIHQLAEQLESNVADILPAIHVLTGLLFTIEQNSSFNSLFSRILKLFFHSEIWF